MECFRGDDELEGRGPKPTCSIPNLLKYSTPFALKDAIDGSAEAMNTIVSLIFLEDCTSILQKLLENIEDIKFVQLFIQQGGLYALLRRISQTSSTQSASLHLSLEIWKALLSGCIKDQMEELLREMDPFETLRHHGLRNGEEDAKPSPEVINRELHAISVHSTPREAPKQWKEGAPESFKRLAQCPDTCVASPEFFNAFFASPEALEKLAPVFLSSTQPAKNLAAHWRKASPPSGSSWDAAVVPSGVEDIFCDALILQPKRIMRCLEVSSFARVGLRALKEVLTKVNDGELLDFVDRLPVKNLTCLLLQLASKVPRLLLPAMEVLGHLSIKDEYREFLLRETSFFDFLCASLYEHAVEGDGKPNPQKGAIVREVAKCLVHLSADVKIKAAAKQSIAINQTLAKTKDPLVRHYLCVLQK